MQVDYRSEVLRERGNEEFKKENLENAIRLYTEAIGFNPNDIRLYNNRALCYIKKELYKEAIEDTLLAIKIDGNNAKANFRCGIAYDKLGNCEEAIEYLATAVKLNPDNIEITELFKTVRDKVVKQHEERIKNLPQISFNSKKELDVDSHILDSIHKYYLDYTDLYAPHKQIRLIDNTKFRNIILDSIPLMCNKIFIGTGFGLYPSLTYNEGDALYCIEKYPSVAQLTHSICSDYKYDKWNSSITDDIRNMDISDKNVLFEKFCENFHLMCCDPTDLKKENVKENIETLIFTDFDFTLLGNKMLITIEHLLKEGIITKDTTILPTKAKVYAKAISFKENGTLYKYRWNTYLEEFDIDNYDSVTDYNEIFEFNFSENIDELTELQRWNIVNNKPIHAIIFYYDLYFNETIYTFKHAIQHISPHIIDDDILEITVKHNKMKISFDMGEEEEKDKQHLINTPYYNIMSNTKKKWYYDGLIRKYDNVESVLVIGNVVTAMKVAEYYDKVHLVEMSKNMSEISRDIIEKHNLEDKIEVINKDILTVFDLKVDLVIYDFVNIDLLSSGFIIHRNHIKKHLANDNCIFIPDTLKIKGKLIQLRTNNIDGYNLELVNQYRWSPEPTEINLDKVEHIVLSEYFDIEQTNKLEIDIIEDGVLSCVAYQFEIDGEVLINNHLLYFLPEVAVKNGDIIKLNMMHNNINILFEYDEKMDTLNIPRYDEEWVNNMTELQNRTKYIIKEAITDGHKYESLINGCLKIAQNPSVYNVDNVYSSRFITSFFT